MKIEDLTSRPITRPRVTNDERLSSARAKEAIERDRAFAQGIRDYEAFRWQAPPRMQQHELDGWWAGRVHAEAKYAGRAS